MSFPAVPKSGLRMVSEHSLTVKQKKDALMRVKGLVQKLEQEEAKALSKAKLAHENMQKRKAMRKKRQEIRDGLDRQNQMHEEKQKEQLERVKAIRRQVREAGKVANEKVRLKNEQAARTMREIKASLSCEEHQHVLDFTAKARSERKRQKDEHAKSKANEQSRRARTARQFNRYRKETQSQLQQMHDDEMQLRQQRVAAQKEERLMESHIEDKRREARKKKLLKLQKQDEDVIQQMNFTDLVPMSQEIAEYEAKYSRMMKRKKAADAKAKRLQDELDTTMPLPNRGSWAVKRVDASVATSSPSRPLAAAVSLPNLRN